MKYIITQAYGQGDLFNKDVALISIADKFKETLRIIKYYIISAPPDLFDYVKVTQYDFGFVDFFDSTLIEDLEDGELSADITTVDAWCANAVGKYSEVEITDILNLHPIIGEGKAYYPKCIVSSYGVSFHAQNKYGDEEEIWTDPIPFETILNF